jgi:hypothetical protein
MNAQESLAMTSYSSGSFTETSCSPRAEPEIRRLPCAAQLPPVTGLRHIKAPPAVPNATSFEPDRWVSTPSLRQPSNPLSNRTKFLIATTVAALPAGYLVFGNSDRPPDVAVAPQATTDIPPVEWETDATPAKSKGITIESKADRDRQMTSSEPMARLDKEPTASGTEARTPRTLPKRGRRPFAVSTDASNCFLSASTVRRNRSPSKRLANATASLGLAKQNNHEVAVIAAQTAQGRDHLFVDRSAKET